MKHCAHKHTRRVRWSMLVSHHAPCDYDRTVSVFGIRVCTRCLGMLAGTFTGWHFAPVCLKIGLVWGLFGALALTVPAACDFTAHELTVRYRSNNLRRLLTGITFGVVVGVCLFSARHGNVWTFLGLGAYLILMQLVIVKLFQICGHFDSYLERYASASYREEEVEQPLPTPPG